MIVRTWNLFNGNTSPQSRKAYLREMVALITADKPDVVCLQEIPAWALKHIGAWSGMQTVTARAKRPKFGPFPIPAFVGRALTAPVALQTAPETPRDEITIHTRSPFSGVKVANLSPALADELQLQNVDDGVVVLDVDAGSYASNLGFQRGDVIEQVNGERSGKTRDLERVSTTPSPSWRIVILRGGQKISAVFNG